MKRVLYPALIALAALTAQAGATTIEKRTVGVKEAMTRARKGERVHARVINNQRRAQGEKVLRPSYRTDFWVNKSGLASMTKILELRPNEKGELVRSASHVKESQITADDEGRVFVSSELGWLRLEK